MIKWDFCADVKSRMVLIWYYYLVESFGYFSTPVRVEVAVSQIVDPYERQPGLFSPFLHMLPDKTPRKDKYPVLVPHAVYLFGVRSHGRHDSGRHRDEPSAIHCLGRSYCARVVMECFIDADGISRKVKISQGERQHLPAPHAGIKEQTQGCFGPYVLYMADEAVILVKCPECHRLGFPAHTSRFCAGIRG